MLLLFYLPSPSIIILSVPCPISPSQLFNMGSLLSASLQDFADGPETQTAYEVNTPHYISTPALTSIPRNASASAPTSAPRCNSIRPAQTPERREIIMIQASVQ